MSEHTPGPWVAETLGNPHWTIHPPNAPGVVAQYVKVEADARLIAAAPDLLEAVRQADDSLHFKQQAVCLYCEVLAKATEVSPQ